MVGVHDPSEVAGTVAREGERVVAPNSAYGDFPVRVERVDAPRYVAFRWASAFPGQELSDDNSTLIEFTLTDEAGRTRLRVVESGFGGLAGSDELRRKALEDNTGGWAEELGYRSFWTAETTGPEAFSVLTAAGAVAPSLDLGTGVLALQLRTPPLVAMAGLLMFPPQLDSMRRAPLLPSAVLPLTPFLVAWLMFTRSQRQA